MRKSLDAKALIYPQPVLIISTYNADGTPNAMTAAWGGVRDQDKVFIVLDENHVTTKNILRNGDFVVSMADSANIVACDYVGMVSADSCPNKIENAGFTVEKSKVINAPLISQLKLALECKLISYEDEVLIGQVVGVSADEEILTDGKVDVAKLQPITYDTAAHTYVALGEVVGKAFSDGNKLKK